MQTRKDEIVKTLKTSEDIMTSVGMYLKEYVCKEWVEDFVDDDTGEVVKLERKEVLFERGILIDELLVPQLLFYFQSGEFSQVVASNQKREAIESSYGFSSYLATVEIGKKKRKFLFKAVTLELAILGLKDFVELNFSGRFRIISIKQFQTQILIQDNLHNLNDLNKDDENIDEFKFYQITIKVCLDSSLVSNAEAIVKSK